MFQQSRSLNRIGYSNIYFHYFYLHAMSYQWNRNYPGTIQECHIKVGLLTPIYLESNDIFVCALLILQVEITRSLFIELGHWFKVPISVRSIHTLMNSRLIMPLNTATIAAVILFTSSLLVSSNQALAFVYVQGHGGHYHVRYFYHGHYFYHNPYYRHYFHHHYYHPFYH